MNETLRKILAQCAVLYILKCLEALTAGTSINYIREKEKRSNKNKNTLVEKGIYSKLNKTASSIPVASVFPGMDHFLPSFFLK